MKYIVTNGNDYIGQNNSKTTSIKKAMVFKYEQAVNYLRHNLKGSNEWTYRRISNKPTGKNYVITNGTNYVSDKGVTFKFNEATRFNSEADALRYVNSHGGFFDKVCIITTNLENIPCEKPRSFTEEQLETLGVSTEKKTKRASFAHKTRLKVFNNYNGICGICGKKLSQDRFTIDHIVPLDRGGDNSISNLQPACETCNKLKGNSKDEEFVQGIANTISYHLEKDFNENIAEKLINTCVRAYLSNVFGEEIANAVIM